MCVRWSRVWSSNSITHDYWTMGQSIIGDLIVITVTSQRRSSIMGPSTYQLSPVS